MNATRVWKQAARSILTQAGLIDAFEAVRRELFTQRKNLLSLEQIDAIYRRQYHESSNYGIDQPTAEWESDETIKTAHARAILEVLPQLRKVVIGGCSSGMAVRALRRVGVDAHGFDISPDLEAMVLPDVRSYVREGSLTSIPFSRHYRFDALITTDVLEHVQLRYMPLAVREIAKLQAPYMVHMINHVSRSHDHMTLRPLAWWVKQFAKYYRLRSDLNARVLDNPRIYGLNGDPQHVFTFWERISG
jgi:hypothetical protein